MKTWNRPGKMKYKDKMNDSEDIWVDLNEVGVHICYLVYI